MLAKKKLIVRISFIYICNHSLLILTILFHTIIVQSTTYDTYNTNIG